MLSRQPCSLHVGGDSRTIAAPPQLLAFPPHPHLLLAGIPPVLHQRSLGGPSPPHSPRYQFRSRTHTQSEHVESGPYCSFPHQTTKEVARRRMKTVPFSSTPPLSTGHISFNLPSYGTQDTPFTFEVSLQPAMALSFPPRPSPTRPRKRCRAIADVDGEHSCLYKKKRRLRLFLITSRLSPQFSHPATNIVDRGSSKIAVWAKQKALGRNILRKAAILNCIRRQSFKERETGEGLGRVLVEQEREQEELRLARLTLVYGSHDSYTRPPTQGLPHPPTGPVVPSDSSERLARSPSNSPPGSPSPPLCPRDADNTSEYRSPNDAYNYSTSRSISPRRSYLPLPPSPLGLSNYDAFDLEDDIHSYTHFDDDYDAGDQDDNMTENAPALPAAASASYPHVVRRGSNEAPNTPPQAIYSDFGILDPDEPVFGDYDQVDEGADALWPDALASEPQLPPPATPLSSSPDFPALFATTGTTTIPLSPNFSSPPLDTVPSPTTSSPNFNTLSPIVDEIRASREHAEPRMHTSEVAVRRDESEMEQERERQRSYMFMRFGS